MNYTEDFTQIRQENLTIDDYTKIININPDRYAFYIKRGILYAKNGDFNKAKDDYTKAIQLNPSSFESYNNRGNLYCEEKIYDLAIADYTKCIQINPMAYQGYINRGSAYGQMSDYRKAIEDFSRAIEINPADYEVYLFRNKAYNALGEENLAVADLERAFEIDWFATEQWIQRRINPPLDSDTAEEHIRDGIELLGSHEYDSAIVEFTEAIKTGSQSGAVAYNHRGMAHAAKKEYALAIEDYKKSLELDHEYAKAYSNLGFVYYIIREYNDAIENLTQAVDRISKIAKFDPYNTKTFLNSLFYRGLSYKDTRKFYLAKKDFAKILDINPDDYEVRILLIDVSKWI
jgi:tetratricopeptide (TPR) repeat protein